MTLDASSNFRTIVLEKKDKVAKIILNRPEVLNAINSEMIVEFKQAVECVGADETVKVIVITGTGRAFAAGADINMIKGLSALEMRDVGIGPSLRLLEHMDKPVVAAINGLALGGGCEIALACDIRICTEDAIFGQPEIRLGVMPGAGGTQRLPRLIGKAKAMELLLTGDTIKASEAKRLGLVNDVVPAAELESAVQRVVKKLLEKSGTTLKLIKSAVIRGMEMNFDAGLAYEREVFSLCFASEDAQEGIAAFLEKRAPQFKGR